MKELQVVMAAILLYPRHSCRRVYSFRISVRPFVCSFVRASITYLEFTTKFSTKLRESLSSGIYLTNYSSESIPIWTMSTLEGLLPCHEFWSQGSCPGLGLEFKI